MSFITELIEVLGSIESNKITVHKERCISIRNRNASCIRCAHACTSGAISYTSNELSVDPDLCIGCGTCATACPTSAIEIKQPSDDELTRSIKNALVVSNGHPVIACETALTDRDPSDYDLNQMSVVPCLGRIDESVLVGLGAYKAYDVTLLCGSCESCQHEPGGRMIREVIPSAHNMLEAFSCTLPIELTEELPTHLTSVSDRPSRAQDQGVSRRGLFSSAKNETTKVASQAVDKKASELMGGKEPVPAAFQKVNEKGTLSHFVPSRRTRIYNYLKHIGEPVAETIETRIIGSLTIDADRCSACRMCAVFCPTGAILKADDADRFGIVHRPSACMQCRLCEHICPEEAISISSIVPTEQFMGKKALYYQMDKPDWEPNRPSSMYDKVHSVIGDDLEMCSF